MQVDTTVAEAHTASEFEAHTASECEAHTASECEAHTASEWGHHRGVSLRENCADVKVER